VRRPPAGRINRAKRWTGALFFVALGVVFAITLIPVGGISAWLGGVAAVLVAGFGIRAALVLTRRG
jgi:uncharacterized membrane protein YhaH (DUF805 family)